MVKSRSRRITRVTHAGRLLAYLCLVAAVGGGAFAAGAMISTPEEAALAGADAVVPVIVSVEDRVVVDQESVQGVVAPGRVISINPGTTDESLRAIVTSQNFDIGETINTGVSLGSLADRPLILIEMPTPMVRDLSFGDSGPDVIRFQEALQKIDTQSVPQTGVVDDLTLDAVRRLYARNEVAAPGAELRETQIAISEYVTLPGPSARLVGRSNVGEMLDSDATFAQLQVSPNYVSTRVNVLQVDSFSVDQIVILRGSGGLETTGSIASISEFLEPDPEQGLASGHDLVIELPTDSETDESLEVNAPVNILADSSTDLSTAVPLISIRQNENGPYVVKQESDGLRTQVPIIIISEGSGWVAIDQNSDLPAGTQLVVDI